MESTGGPLSVCALKCNIPVHFFCTSLWQFLFLHVALFSYCAPCPCCTFLCSNVFMLHFFSSCTLFRNCSISFYTFTSYNVFVLQFRILQFFPVALCSLCTIPRIVARIPTNIYDVEVCKNNYQSR